LGPYRWPCALGSGGIRAIKREGDGATPRGLFKVLRAYYRPDKFSRLPAAVALAPTAPCAGWCDAPGDPNYNRRVPLPYRASAERMWRDDDLYDAVLVLDYNIRPRVRGAGSAIFLHIARDGYAPTEGCVAVSKHDMRQLLSRLRRGTRLLIR
jgi:L,D-peptidoglycan transpeptidase YkuD (ErfK/YbiS/YcfS/YnhG family)